MSNDLVIYQDENSLMPADSLQEAFKILLYSLSDTSKRQYEHTFKTWTAFCQANDLSFSDLGAANLIRFLEGSGLSHSTKQARLSHIRKLLETLHAATPDDSRIKRMYEQVKLLKLKRGQEEKQSERESHALSPKQIYAALEVWKGHSFKAVRNRALLAVLVYAGLRRSEAAALKWSDIDFENGIITVRHGKGDKRREIPFLGEIEDFLKEWQVASLWRSFVFCALQKGDKLAEDAPMTTKAIYEVLRQTGDAIGIDFLAPHDMRRTLITNALNAGASVADMQFVAGHSQASTTLRYAKVKDAQEVKGRLTNIGF